MKEEDALLLQEQEPEEVEEDETQRKKGKSKKKRKKGREEEAAAALGDDKEEAGIGEVDVVAGEVEEKLKVDDDENEDKNYAPMDEVKEETADEKVKVGKGQYKFCLDFE